ncbi:MAG TPA: tetratricopeptide repeat protein [Candidatus Limnocylindria bacterium]|nr:tetratricopeptide repeat protein [Candidatus Limnocylindria bacterium]
MRSQLVISGAARSLRIALVIGGLVGIQSQVSAQSDQRAKAAELIKAQKFTEALPLLEELVKATPNDGEVQYYLGFALFGQAINTEDKTAAQQMRARARQAFVKAKELGNDSQLVQAMIDGTPVDGSEPEGSKYSENPEAEKMMATGEAAFARGEMDKALESYQKALNLDPKLYYAALYSGDVNLHRGKFADAETWYQKAIAIDPYIETAYRYSATPLMKQGKTAQARDRYVEAFIVSPYNRLAMGGIIQWAEVTRTSLGHPTIDVPETTVGADGKEKTTINVNPMADDGSMAWIAYSATRELWKKEKFAKTYPTEKAYRHTLAEEADALRSVVTMAKTLKAKTLNSQIATLEKLDKEGLLEAYVIMARPNDGIAQDHPAYLRANRDKLRRYVVTYVIDGGK